MSIQSLAAVIFLAVLVNIAVARDALPSSELRKSLAEELTDSIHYRLTSSTPQLTAIVKWHDAVINNNFNAYQEVSFDATALLYGGGNKESSKSMFLEIKNSIPLNVMITAPFAMPSGNFLFHASGCKNNYIHEAIISVGFDGKIWRVLGGVWTPNSKKSTCSAQT